MSHKSQKQYKYKGYDYSQDDFYFVTICCKNREIFFGDIVGAEHALFLQASEIGKIAKKFWLEIPDHFSFVKLDRYIIMPNHFHGIIEIDNENNYCRNIGHIHRNRACSVPVG